MRTPSAGNLVKWLYGLVETGLGVWVAAELVAGIHLTGPARDRVLAVAVAVAVAHAVPYLLRRVGSAVWRGAVRRVRSGWAAFALSGAAVTGGLGVVIALAPFTLWLGATVCGALGLPLRIAGFWPLIVGAVVQMTTAIVLGLLRECFTARGRANGRPAACARLAIGLGALWLALLALPGVTMAGDGLRRWLTLAVLAALFNVFNISVSSTRPPRRLVRSIPWAAGYAFVANAVVLWLVSWFSTGLRLPLRIDGFGTLLLAALLCTAVMWLAHLPLLVVPWHRYRRRGVRPGHVDEAGRVLVLRVSRFGYRWARARPDGPPPPPPPVYHPPDPTPGIYW